MSTQNLSKIFHPRSVAVVGASAKENSVGFTILKNLVEAKFKGSIFPINPKHKELLGKECFPSVKELPSTPDLVIVATPAPTIPQVADECGELGVSGLILISAGFREVGREGKALEQELEKVLARYPSMRAMGPNCVGVLVPSSRLNASFATTMPKSGRIAFISQSGALCTSILDWSLSQHIGFSYFISIGNALDVKVGDLIDYLAEDPMTDSIVLYVESITEARRFMSAARAFTRTKPIVVYKAGRFAESAKVATSHTGAMAGEDDVYEAAFQRAGMVRVYDAADMFDCAEILARHRTPNGPRLAVITNAGGPGVMATDELLFRNGQLAELEQNTIAELNTFLPPHWSHGNPVDLLGDAVPEVFQKATDLVVGDRNVDVVLVILTPQAMTDPTKTAELIAASSSRTYKPILAVWMGGDTVEPGREILNRAGIATYDSPDRAVRAFTYLVSYKRTREMLYETPHHIQLEPQVDSRLARELLQDFQQEGRETLAEIESKALLSAYGIPCTKPRPARTSQEALDIAEEIGYPIVMKILSPDILHKTEVHGVITGISDGTELQLAYSDMIDRARKMRPDAEILGVTIQPMISSAEGIELIVGAKRDPVFGSLILVGAGGVTAELLRDRVLELPPLNERLARRMLESLKIWPLLEGYRGRNPIHLNRLIEVLLRISSLIVNNPEILELDVNPLLVTPDGVTALDARAILDTTEKKSSKRPYTHLAIRPYPEEYIRQETLRDGANVLLRPIQPEDEPMWHDLLGRCSERSIWLRFRYVFKETTHEMATRFCFIDYDRTMAIVAEVEKDDQKQLVGVGRLVADADRREAEYAVLVADAWQGRGLGSMLTDYCFEICHDWNIERLTIETTVDNQRMQRIAKKNGFYKQQTASNEVLFQKQLDASTQVTSPDNNSVEKNDTKVST